jgi:hypothetical protein
MSWLAGRYTFLASGDTMKPSGARRVTRALVAVLLLITTAKVSRVPGLAGGSWAGITRAEITEASVAIADSINITNPKQMPFNLFNCTSVICSMPV